MKMATMADSWSPSTSTPANTALAYRRSCAGLAVLIPISMPAAQSNGQRLAKASGMTLRPPSGRAGSGGLWYRCSFLGRPRAHAGCDGRHLVWAGSHQGSLLPTAHAPAYSLPPTDPDSFAERVRSALISTLKKHFVTSDRSSLEWISNVSAHVEQPLKGSAPLSSPSAFLLFPTYHGERQSFNGYCGDATSDGLPCLCSHRRSNCKKRSPSCYGKELCEPLPRGSVRFTRGAHLCCCAIEARFHRRQHRRSSDSSNSVYDDCGPAANVAWVTALAMRGWMQPTSAVPLRCSALWRLGPRCLNGPNRGFQLTIRLLLCSISTTDRRKRRRMPHSAAGART